MRPIFLVDVNVGRLARRLRMLGYDARFVLANDNELIRIALRENRILVTRDTGIIERRVVAIGQVRAILIKSDEVQEQLMQVVQELNLQLDTEPFSRCMECNEQLIVREKQEIRNLVPPYVFKTQDRFVQCPLCERIYWQGTHWQRMRQEIERLKALHT